MFRGYMRALGNPPDAPTQALVLAAAEAIVIAETARAECLGNTSDVRINSMVRAENAANRSLKRLGLNKAAATKPAGPSIQDIKARYANAPSATAATSEADT